MRAQGIIRAAANDLGEDPDLDCLVAEEDGTIIGVVVYRPRDERGFGVVVSIGVTKEKQRNGIATDLKRQVLDNCTRAGASRVLSEVHRKNTKMQGVNDKLGIEKTENPGDGKHYFYAAQLVPEDDD